MLPGSHLVSSFFFFLLSLFRSLFHASSSYRLCPERVHLLHLPSFTIQAKNKTEPWKLWKPSLNFGFRPKAKICRASDTHAFDIDSWRSHFVELKMNIRLILFVFLLRCLSFGIMAKDVTSTASSSKFCFPTEVIRFDIVKRKITFLLSKFTHHLHQSRMLIM